MMTLSFHSITFKVSGRYVKNMSSILVSTL